MTGQLSCTEPMFIQHVVPVILLFGPHYPQVMEKGLTDEPAPILERFAHIKRVLQKRNT